MACSAFLSSRMKAERGAAEAPENTDRRGGVDAPHRVFLNFFDHRHQAAEQVAGILVGRVHVRIDLLVATGAFWKMAAAALEHRLDEGGTSVAPLKVKQSRRPISARARSTARCRSPRGNGPPVSAERTTWAPSEAGTRLSSPWTASDRRRTRNGRVGGRSPPFGRGVFHATANPRSTGRGCCAPLDGSLYPLADDGAPLGACQHQGVEVSWVNDCGWLAKRKER